MPTVRLTDLVQIADYLFDLHLKRTRFINANWTGSSEVEKAAAAIAMLDNIEEYARAALETVQAIEDAQLLGQPVTIDYT